VRSWRFGIFHGQGATWLRKPEKKLFYFCSTFAPRQLPSFKTCETPANPHEYWIRWVLKQRQATPENTLFGNPKSGASANFATRA
jgi:hypothetical protein